VVEGDVAAMHVRLAPDAEPVLVDAVVDCRTDTKTWWRAEIIRHDPITGHSLILDGGATAYQWLSGTGLHRRDVPDAAGLRLVTLAAPSAWAADAVVYQVFPDRFATAVERLLPDWNVPAEWDDRVGLSDGSGARQLCGGDLDGVVEHLYHLRSLGVDVPYLTPFFPSRSNHRYDASSFDQVDPALGGAEFLGSPLMVPRLGAPS
jgi:alpha-glucosidase